jgi:hypothetical protein
MRRAEVEGQIGRYRTNPSLLGDLAATYARLHPDGPRLTRLYLINRSVRLKDRRPVAAYDVAVASWP